MNTRGISAVVATVLIILVTVAAIGLVWSFILPTITIQDSSFNVDVRFDVISHGVHTLYDQADMLVSINVQRFNDDATMNTMKLILWEGGNSYSHIVSVPGINQAKVYVFNLSACGISPDHVNIAPLFVSESSEVEGIAGNKFEIPPGDIVNASGVTQFDC